MPSISFSTIKDIFYLIGSIAGILSIAKPVFESKFESDKKKLEVILELIPEKDMIYLVEEIWGSRRASDRILNNLSRVCFEVEERLNAVTFYGPLAKLINAEMKSIVDAEKSLRDLIQVDYWLPRKHEEWSGWVFNKKSFFENKEDYVVHLESAHDRALIIRNHVRRLQILKDTHFIESFMPNRFVTNRLNEANIEPAT